MRRPPCLDTEVRLAASLAPVDIARVALFLASDEARGVNGAIVTVDGGWTAH